MSNCSKCHQGGLVRRHPGSTHTRISGWRWVASDGHITTTSVVAESQLQRTEPKQYRSKLLFVTDGDAIAVAQHRNVNTFISGNLVVECADGLQHRATAVNSLSAGWSKTARLLTQSRGKNASDSSLQPSCKLMPHHWSGLRDLREHRKLLVPCCCQVTAGHTVLLDTLPQSPSCRRLGERSQ